MNVHNSEGIIDNLRNWGTGQQKKISKSAELMKEARSCLFALMTDKPCAESLVNRVRDLRNALVEFREKPGIGQAMKSEIDELDVRSLTWISEHSNLKMIEELRKAYTDKFLQISYSNLRTGETREQALSDMKELAKQLIKDSSRLEELSGKSYQADREYLEKFLKYE